jgi:putative sterol carrier protein
MAAAAIPLPPAAEAADRLGPGFSSRSRLVVDELFGHLPTYFDPDQAGQLAVVFEWRIGHGSGPPDRYQLVIEAGRCQVDKDGFAKPEAVLSADWLDFMRLMLGDVTATKLFLRGRLKIEGNVLLASRLKGLFCTPRPVAGELPAG